MTWTPLHARLHTTLRQRQLLQPNQSLLIALSGGQDSLCLSKLLLDLQPKWDWQLGIAHCDHRWTSDVGMADHVQQIAEIWQLPFYLKTACENSPETESAARKWRYQALAEIASEQGFKSILTGHTQSDRAETLLYNLVRGSGTDGLGALTWKRALTPQIELVRPLLNFSRRETLQFCQQFQLPIWEDSLNQTLKYSRNRLRIEVIPYLQTHFNPQVETALAQTAEVLKAEADYLNAEADKLLENLIHPPDQLYRLPLQSVPLALQRRVMRQFLQTFLKSSPNFEQIESLITLIAAPNRSRTSTLPGGIIAEVQGDFIRFYG